VRRRPLAALIGGVMPQHARSIRQRPSYHPRPHPRRRMDLMGFNAGMWLIAVVLIIVLLLWY
jgi:hypothetical protein